MNRIIYLASRLMFKICIDRQRMTDVRKRFIFLNKQQLISVSPLRWMETPLNTVRTSQVAFSQFTQKTAAIFV